MNREQAKKNLEAIGIAEVTDEQITAYLNQVNGEKANDAKTIEKLKGDSAKMLELQKALDEINNKDKTDFEKATARIAELEKQIETNRIHAELSKLGIQGDHLEKFFDADGKVDFAVLGQILSDRETSAKSAKEKELLEKTKSPQGGNGGQDTRTEAEKLAETIGKRLAKNNDIDSDALANYE